MGSTSGVSSSAALVAGSLLVAASLGLYSWGSSSSNKVSGSTSRRAGEITDIDEDDDNDKGEFITPEEVRQVFDKLHVEMQNVFAQLMQQVQQIQMSGASVSERQLKGLVIAEMERSLTVKQKTILDEFDMDYDCLEQATWEFLSEGDDKDESKDDSLSSSTTQSHPHAQVIKSVERFQKFWQTATGQVVAGWRPGKTAEQMQAAAKTEVLSAERTIQVAEVYFGSMTDTMRKLVAQYKAQGKNLQEPAVAQQLNAAFARQANEAGEAALEEKCGGVTQAQFEASVKAHSDNPNVARALGMLQMQQQQELMAMSQM